jgi:hypothetical protein
MNAFICDAIRTPIGRYGGHLIRDSMDLIQETVPSFILDEFERD